MGRYTGKTCRLIVMLSLTFGFFIVEIVFGYITHSMALIADSFHMLSDVLALIVAFCCMKISKKKSNKNTFGWVRAEVLGALVNAVFLMALCFSIVIEALKRLIEPETIEQPINILIVGALGFLINIVGIFMFHGHASVHGHSHARPVPLDLPTEDEEDEEEKLGPIVSQSHNISVLVDDNKKIESTKSPSSEFYSNNHSGAEKQLLQNRKNEKQHEKQSGSSSTQLNMHGVFLHILGDAFGSVIVIINAIICIFVDNENVKKYLDPSLSLGIALIITCTTLPLLKESALILLQTVPTHINIQETKAKLLKSIDGVLAVHEFHVWRLAGNKIIATAHIRCRSLEDYMKIAEKVKEFFHHEGIHSTTIQPEFAEVDLPQDDECVLECPKKSECAPSTCCGPKLAPVNQNSAALRNAEQSSFVDATAVEYEAALKQEDLEEFPPMLPPYSQTVQQQSRQTPKLQRRLSKSEDNLTSDLDGIRIENAPLIFSSTPIRPPTTMTTTSVVDDTRADLGSDVSASFSKEAAKIDREQINI